MSTLYLEQEIEHIKQSLRSNGYNMKLINQIVRKKRRNMLNPQSDTQSHQPNNDEHKYVSAPYIKGASEKMTRILKPHKIILANKTTTTLKSKLQSLKDPVPLNETTNIIYQIPCSDCDQVYIGETSRNINKRNEEHKNAIGRRDQNSQIFQHVTQELHQVQWNNTRILDRNNNLKQRKFIEACYTQANPKAINRAVDIPPILAPAIKKVCDKLKF